VERLGAFIHIKALMRIPFVNINAAHSRRVCSASMLKVDVFIRYAEHLTNSIHFAI
jgi:hypothetical protein